MRAAGGESNGLPLSCRPNHRAEGGAGGTSEDGRIEEALLSGAADCHQQIRRLSERIAQNEETQAAAEEMFGPSRR